MHERHSFVLFPFHFHSFYIFFQLRQSFLNFHFSIWKYLEILFSCVKPNVIVFSREIKLSTEWIVLFFSPGRIFIFHVANWVKKMFFQERIFCIFSPTKTFSFTQKNSLFLPHHSESYQHRFATIIFPSFPNFCEEKLQEKHFYFLCEPEWRRTFLFSLAKTFFTLFRTWRKNCFFCMLSQTDGWMDGWINK